MSDDSTVVLGKRKEREYAERRPAGSTIFVSNLPYTATSTDLETLFSDLGPVRSAFVVLEENVSKGVGYVSFAIKDDAVTAMKTIEKDGITLNGRKLRVQWAERKTDEKKVKVERKPPAVPRSSFPKSEKDPNAIRTIIISGLPSSVDQNTLWKKVRKCKGAESTELVAGETGIAHVLFSNPSAAAHAVEKLHAHVYKGALLSATLKKRLESLAKNPAKKGVNTATTPSRASRLIVRNVPWNITEKDLRALFLPFGPVFSTTIPAEKTSDEAENKKPRARGFAFVWFFSKKDAERAIEGVNGRAVVAGAIVAPTMNKKERARLRKQLREKEKEKEEVQEEEGEEAVDTADEGEDEKKMENEKPEARVLAVDWALSKEKWEEAKTRGLTGQGGQDENASESGSDLNSDSASDSESDVSDEDVGEEGSDDEMDAGEDRSDSEEPRKPTLPQTDNGTTLFVRNVPFDATEDEMRVLFRAFGPLRYARITMDVESGRSRGTAFVCFWNKEDADKAILQSELLNREAAPNAPKKNPFSLPSLLTPDPSSSLAQSLVLHGRALDVTRAVTRDSAQRLKDEGERQREKADKRNMYLLREGVIFPNTPAAATLSPAELEKRSASFSTRRTLLKSNPTLYVSKTRLSIRQLPMFTTERTLKRLGIHAVRAFEKEVKSGERQPLSADELHEDIEDVEMVDEKEKVKEKGKEKGKGWKSERETGVKQAKIVRQADRVDTLTGKGKSRGYGFLEMRLHSDALRVLRWANNNPVVGELLEQWWRAELDELTKSLEAAAKKPKPKDGNEEGQDVEARVRRLKGERERLESSEWRKGRKTLVVEFSIENAQVVNRRKEKMETTKTASRSPRLKPTGDRNGHDDAHEDEKPSKRRKVIGDLQAKTGTVPKSETSVDGHKSSKQDNGLGGLIGRKRKMRKSKGKA
ncbi:RNA-binding domain-containing protein [Phellopilus nigrolimitatus]|nr:RNA-binding domain-containing protein [Phellopilus nigrolimitatus]